MQPLDGVKLEDLVKQASNDLLAKRKQELSTKIQAIFHRVDGLNEEIRKLENDLAKKRKKLESANAKLTKLRQGDWTVLEDEKKQDNNTTD